MVDASASCSLNGSPDRNSRWPAPESGVDGNGAGIYHMHVVSGNGPVSVFSKRPNVNFVPVISSIFATNTSTKPDYKSEQRWIGDKR